MIQKQTWKDEIRILITDEENLSSVQISIPLYVSDLFGKADALIYALFVDNNHRRKGVSGIPGMDAYHKQFAKPNMPTHWMEMPTHP